MKDEENLADVAANDQWIHRDDNKCEPPVQDEGDDEWGYSQTNVNY